jgi:hypothetical protein
LRQTIPIGGSLFTIVDALRNIRLFPQRLVHDPSERFVTPQVSGHGMLLAARIGAALSRSAIISSRSIATMKAARAEYLLS